MLYLLHVHWLFLFGAVALGVIVGWMTRLPHFTRWTDRWVRLVAAVVAIATVVTLTRLVPGRAGYWLELAAAFSIVYFIGCFVGWALRDLADFQVADAPGAADPSYLFRRNFAGLAGLDFYMRHPDAGGPGQGQQPRPLFGSYVAGQLNIPRAGYVFPTTAPTTGATALVRGETTPSGQRKHWSWPGAAVASAGTPVYRFADDAFDAIKGGYVFPSALASNPIGDATRQGTTTGLRRHWSWPSATGAAAPIAATRTDVRAADASPAVASPARAAAAAGLTSDRAVSRDAIPTVGQTGRSAAAASAGGETQARPAGGTTSPAGVSASPDVGSRSAEPGNAGTAGRAGSQPAGAASTPRASIPSAGGSSSAQTSGGGSSPSTPSAAARPDANATRPSPAASASGAAHGGTPSAETSPAPTSAAPPKGSQVAGAPGEGASGAPTGSPQAGAAAAAVDQRPSSSPSGASSSPKQAASGGPSGSPSPASGVSAPTATSGAGATRVPGSAGAGVTSSSRPAAASPATGTSSETSSGPAGAGTTPAQSKTETGGTAGARAAPASAGGGLAAAAPPTPSATAAPSAAGSANPPKIESLPNEELHAGERPEGLVAARNNRADDLKWIKGIGPQNEGRLHGLGVWHFDQIAAWTPDNVKWVGSYLAFHGRIDREKWIEQATQLARGETTDFSKRVASGKVSTSRDDGGHGQSNVDADILSRPRKR